MKKIRFFSRGIYRNVIDSMINPIIKYLPEGFYEIDESGYDYENRKWITQADENYFDVNFFSDACRKFDLFISHGIADKNYRNVEHMQNFEFVAVSGKAWLDKYVSQGMDKDRILIIGYPKLDPIFQSRNKIIHTDGKIHVLYAPTHNMNPNSTKTVSSYPRLLPQLEKLSNDIEIRIATHPANKENHEITFDDYEWADVVVGDSGSSLYEAWSLDIPVCFPDWLVKDNVFNNFPNSFEEQIYKEQIGYHAENIGHMNELIYQAKEKGLDNKTKEFIEGILPSEIRGKSGKILSEIFMNLIGNKVLSAFLYLSTIFTMTVGEFLCWI
jgi:hypothetical protein